MFNDFNALNALSLSRAIGCHRTTVYQRLKEGLPRNKDGSFDLPKVIRWLIEREKQAVIEEHGVNGSHESPGLERFREARAAIAELNLKVRTGELVPADQLERDLARRVMVFKSDLQNFAYSKSPEICRLVDGDETKIPDLVWHLNESFEMFLDRYSRQP